MHEIISIFQFRGQNSKCYNFVKDNRILSTELEQTLSISCHKIDNLLNSVDKIENLPNSVGRNCITYTIPCTKSITYPILWDRIANLHNFVDKIERLYRILWTKLTALSDSVDRIGKALHFRGQN